MENCGQHVIRVFRCRLTYLLAAESISHFLFPAPGEVAAHFRAGRIATPAFDLLVTAFACAIIFGWYLIYAESHGQKIPIPDWLNALQVRLYLFLHQPALPGRFRDAARGWSPYRGCSRAKQSLFRCCRFARCCRGAALFGPSSPAFRTSELIVDRPRGPALPLFPLHGLYIAALTRLPRFLSVTFALIVPAAGLVHAGQMSCRRFPCGPQRPRPVWRALWIVQGSRSDQSSGTSGLREHAHFFRSSGGCGAYRCLTLNRSSTLSQSWCSSLLLLDVAMAGAARRQSDAGADARIGPAYATLCHHLSLLIMAGIGLPPFGLFPHSMAMLLQPGSLTLLGCL